MVCGLLTDASQNDMVSPVDKKAVNKVIGFLLERLAIVQLISLGKEQSMVAILVDTIP